MGGDATPRRRRRNVEQTRQAIIDATLAALHEGEFNATAKTIAARAQTSERSVFVHFTSLDDIRFAVTDAQASRVEALVTPVDATLPLPQRIDAVVRQSEQVYALQRNPRLAGLLQLQSVPAVDARMRVTENAIREALTETFAPELTRAGGLDEQLLDLVDATVGWGNRHYLVERRGLSQAAASEAIRRALTALLQSPPGGS